MKSFFNSRLKFIISLRCAFQYWMNRLPELQIWKYLHENLQNVLKYMSRCFLIECKIPIFEGNMVQHFSITFFAWTFFLQYQRHSMHVCIIYFNYGNFSLFCCYFFHLYVNSKLLIIEIINNRNLLICSYIFCLPHGSTLFTNSKNIFVIYGHFAEKLQCVQLLSCKCLLKFRAC